MNKTEEALKEAQTNRIQEFLKDYKALTEKHDVDFANYPAFIPTKEGKFEIVVMSTPVDLKLQRLNQSFIAK